MPTFFKHKKQLILTPEKIMLRVPCSSPFSRHNAIKYGIKTTLKSAQLTFKLPTHDQFKQAMPTKKAAMLTLLESKLESFRKALCFLNKEHEGNITLADTEEFYTKVKSYISGLGFPIQGLQTRRTAHTGSASQNSRFCR